ncbi:MAG: glycosyltransferase [Nitrososphaerota archaeon]|nr:glycosyltransferase [Nitrososphaerota archaeon]
MLPISLRITVIVIATHRTAFLKQALASVLNQDVDPACYEIILIKNYVDDSLDSELRELASGRPFKIITTASELLGKKVVEASHNSSGSIVSFLDDDDIWESFKLKSVLEFFDKYDDLVYLHNDQSVIDVDGNIKSFLRFRPTRGQIPIECGDWILRMKCFLRNRADFNGSSISLLRDIVVTNEKVLSEINSPVDSYLFYFALKSGGRILIDSRKLTRYRVSDTSLSLAGRLDGPGFFKNRCNYHMLQAQSFEDLKTLSKSDPVGHVMASIQSLNHSILATVYGQKTPKRIMVSYLRSWILSSLKYRLVYEPTVFLLGATYVFSARLSARFSYVIDRARWL